MLLLLGLLAWSSLPALLLALLRFTLLAALSALSGLRLLLALLLLTLLLTLLLLTLLAAARELLHLPLQLFGLATQHLLLPALL